MVIIDITNVQPFDVLLTAGDAKISGFINVAQKIVRSRSAPYSHAAMFLSPFLLVESLNEPGIVLSDLFEGAVNPHGRGAEIEKDEDSLFFVTTKPSTRLYLRLKGVSAAEIRRYRPLEGLSQAQLNRHTEPVLNAISAVYLAKYPPIARLLRTADLLPEGVMNLLERIGARWEGKKVTGPFCSELVTLLLAAIDPAIVAGRRDASAMAPADIHHDDDMFLFVHADVYRDENCISGHKLSEISVKLNKYIKINTKSQEFNSRIIELNHLLANKLAVIPLKNEFLYKNIPIDKYYHDLMERQRAFWLKDVKDHMLEAAFVSKWLNDTNSCAATCPLNRPSPPENSKRPRLKLSWEHDGPASESCADVRFCPNSPWTWKKLEFALMERSEARLLAGVKSFPV